MASSEEVRRFSAGILCGMICTVTFNPLECLKVRWQVQGARHGDTIRTFVARILREEGLFRGFWFPGLIPYTTSMSLTFGLRMSAYETVRDSLVKIRGKKDSSVMFLSGLLTGSISYWCVNPLYQIKNKLQGQKGVIKDGVPPKFTGMIQGVKLIYKNEGIKGLYLGSSVLFIRGACYHSGHMLGYDFTKTFILKHGLMEDTPKLHSFAALNSAILASFFSCPADCMLSTFQNSSNKNMGIFRYTGNFIKQNGIFSLWRGWTPFLMRVCPLHVLQMPLLEAIRKNVFGLEYFK